MKFVLELVVYIAVYLLFVYIMDAPPWAGVGFAWLGSRNFVKDLL